MAAVGTEGGRGGAVVVATARRHQGREGGDVVVATARRHQEGEGGDVVVATARRHWGAYRKETSNYI